MPQTGPNQVWSWDIKITCRDSCAANITQLYLIKDIYSRNQSGWAGKCMIKSFYFKCGRRFDAI